jgi:hypothetical protein
MQYFLEKVAALSVISCSTFSRETGTKIGLNKQKIGLNERRMEQAFCLFPSERYLWDNSTEIN